MQLGEVRQNHEQQYKDNLDLFPDNPMQQYTDARYLLCIVNDPFKNR